ncbi:hypothetical protein [Asaia sp. As-1742]|uniref:hypothetical protein n=1 Tax=Asaia sp. As-1742 TaxID=2608325 RepID=UPI0014218C5C|nr:hypothetical protein [Asaia sp. As-1742]NIE79818.1 hypothetical protein [Asaia sp. As-1742]
MSDRDTRIGCVLLCAAAVISQALTMNACAGLAVGVIVSQYAWGSFFGRRNSRCGVGTPCSRAGEREIVSKLHEQLD